MKVLVIGQGGREHALVKALSLSHSVTGIHSIPGSEAISKLSFCHPYDLSVPESIIQFCIRTEIDYVFIGPEKPLVEGLADELRNRGILVVGPDKLGAKLEGSKAYAKEFMMEAGIPTPQYHLLKSAKDIAQTPFPLPWLIRVDSLTFGKGTFVCLTQDEVKIALNKIFVEKLFGEQNALVEEYLEGQELTCQIFTNGKDYQVLAQAKDYKRLLNGNLGPTTPGMGSAAPIHIAPELDLQIRQTIIEPTLRVLKNKGCLYRGVLSFNLIIRNSIVFLLEYNIRFGDPEAQVVLPLLESDLGLALHRLSVGEVTPLKWRHDLHAVGVVLAPPGYPNNPQQGVEIQGDIEFETPSSYFIHSSCIKLNGIWQTQGSRALTAVGLGSTATEATKNAYSQASHVQWQNLVRRDDIGFNTISALAE